MGATSSGLLDETRTSSIRGRVDGVLQSFGGFYRQQYSAAYIGHLQQEVEPKKEGRGLLLTQAPPCAPDEVLHRCRVRSSCWDDDQGKKCRERLTVLRRRDRLEIHESLETFSRGSAATLVLQPAGGSVFTKEEESRAQLEMTCAAVLNGVKEASSSSSVVSSPDMPAVYLLLPYMGRTCFLFQQEEERDHFLSALRTCIRHSNLDPWCDPSYERLAFVRALCLYRRDRGCYESWEKLLGSEEHVLASQVMEEVSSWLQSQIQSRLKGKKTERMRQWLATVQEAYVLVLDQLGPGLEALRLGCRRTALANQGLIRSNLDQITSSLCFLENKIRACVCEEAGRECRDSIGPYLSSVLDVLTGNIRAAMQRMKEELSREMDVRQTGRETDGMKTVLAPLGSFRQVESLNLDLDLEDLSERFGRSSTQRLIQSAHLEVEKLMENAVYTFQLFLQSSHRLPVDKERTKELVLKQLDYDSRLVQMRLFHEALLEISLPALSRTLDTKWTSELQQLEQHIFSDVSSFILIHNVFEGVVRQVVSQEIQTAVQEAAVKKSSGLSLDASDLDVSQYCLLDPTPPCSAPGTPAVAARSSSPGPEGGGAVSPEACPQSPSDLNVDPKSASSSPVLVVLQQFNEPASEGASLLEDIHLGTGNASTAESASPEPDRPDPPAGPGSTNLIPDPAELPESSSDVQPAPPETLTAPDLPAGGEDTPLWTHAPMKISLLSLSEAIGCNSAALPVMQTTTDRAVYLTGGIKDSWEEETDRRSDRKQEETDRRRDRKQEETDRRRDRKQEETDRKQEGETDRKQEGETDRKQEETDRRRDRKHEETDRRRDRKHEETDRRRDRKQEETDRKQEETDRKQEETDRRTDRKQSGRQPVDEESTAAFTTEQRV